MFSYVGLYVDLVPEIAPPRQVFMGTKNTRSNTYDYDTIAHASESRPDQSKVAQTYSEIVGHDLEMLLAFLWILHGYSL